MPRTVRRASQHRQLVTLHAGRSLRRQCALRHTIKVFDAKSGLCRCTLTGHTDSVLECDLSPNGKLLVSVSMDGAARLWSLHSAHCLRVYHGHKPNTWVKCVRFLKDGTGFLTGGLDGRVVCCGVWTRSSMCRCRCRCRHSRRRRHSWALRRSWRSAGVRVLPYQAQVRPEHLTLPPSQRSLSQQQDVSRRAAEKPPRSGSSSSNVSSRKARRRLQKDTWRQTRC
jgi:WD40 repeat protein